MSGRVSLVGAGPGDPGLLTRRAVARLRHADLVLYDALVPAAVLKIASRARRFYVGKRAGRHSIRQDAINRLMIRAARRGDRVVRLKCGDPFVFGRGGEEAIALRAAGIDVEVVPGVTSAFAAPALAGIPVTHRGHSAAVVVVSGHAAEAFRPVVDGVAPGTATLVVLMGVANRGVIARHLLDRGWAPDTATALIFGASHENGHRWTGRLDALADAPAAPDDAPGTIVIGSVVTLSPLVGSAIAASTREAAEPASRPARGTDGARRGAARSGRG
ncbi:MAG TPA: uroporphyrinogen-III C-methyltransferase [Vicinamibacterales bacterium]|nr:uroporphyrinogen-III C-methyltransferase [Vicinamibacterales bacterium]